MKMKNIVKHGVENSPVSVSKAPQGSKKHKADVLTYINKMTEMYDGPRISDQPILKNNINKKPHYPTQATPEQFGKLAERVERARQMTGEKKQLTSWEIMKKAADTPEEKKEIREIIREDYKKHGAKDMDPDDLKWIGKGKITDPVKIDINGISESINNYINLTRPIKETVEVPPTRKKFRDPDLDKGLAAILGGYHE
jgi:hypothetical protein